MSTTGAINAFQPIVRDESIPSDFSHVCRLQGEIEAVLAAASFGDHDVFAVKLAFEEALVNAIKHGNGLDPCKHVHVRYAISPDRVDIRIADEGSGFNPEDIPDPTAPENLERPCGRGLLLMRHYMTEVNYSACGRIVQMCRVSQK